MRVLITGGNGQLGNALVKTLGSHTVEAPGRKRMDIVDFEIVSLYVRQFSPDVVIHTAALTDVDRCSREPERAYRVNAIGTQNVALACADVGAAMVYISTNEVFDGTALEPYLEWQRPNPINAYARSKAAGEWYVRHLLRRFYIVRTAWLFASGGRNFLHRIIELADRPAPVRVVTDEVGNPTYVSDLAFALAALITTGAYGIYHLTNAGFCSRYTFAMEILRLTGRGEVNVEPISSDEFERASNPPRFAPLANIAGAAIGITLRPWEKALASFLNPSDR